MFQKFSVGDFLFHERLFDKVIVDAVFLPRSRVPGRVRDAKSERIRVIFVQFFNQSTFPDARWTDDD